MGVKTMNLLLAKARKYSVAFWLVTATLIIEGTCSLSWWHPYCNTQSDGASYFGVGFPLPYAQPTGVSSLEHFVMPHIFLLNLFFVGALLYPVLRFVLGRIAATSSTAASIAAFTGLALLLTAIALTAKFAISGWYIPVMSIASQPDSYWSYMPAFIALQLSNQACYL